jgi:hypothetical protein
MQRRLTRTSGANYDMTRLVGLPAARALLAFGQGQFARTDKLLRGLPPVAHKLGGSHAQRCPATHAGGRGKRGAAFQIPACRLITHK